MLEGSDSSNSKGLLNTNLEPFGTSFVILGSVCLPSLILTRAKEQWRVQHHPAVSCIREQEMLKHG